MKQISMFDVISKPKNVKVKKAPKNVRLKYNQWWCPYCNMPVVFVKDKNLGVKKCPICGISANDYWVKRINPKNK